jgi:hypothetical protein
MEQCLVSYRQGKVFLRQSDSQDAKTSFITRKIRMTRPTGNQTNFQVIRRAFQYFCTDVKHGLLQVKFDVRYKLL